MTLEEFLLGGNGEALPTPLADPFAKPDMLAEADVQRISWEVASDTLWILLDLKGAYQYPEANTAVIRIRGVRSLEWAGKSAGQRGGWSTQLLGTSSLLEGDGHLRLRLGGVNGEVLAVVADVMDFVEGNVPGADAAPPDYEDDDEQLIRAGLTTWTSAFQPVARVERLVTGSE